MQEHMQDTNDDEEVAPDETQSSGNVMKAYKCWQVISKMNIEKHPQKQNDHYNLRSKGAPPTLGEM